MAPFQISIIVVRKVVRASVVLTICADSGFVSNADQSDIPFDDQTADLSDRVIHVDYIRCGERIAVIVEVLQKYWKR